MAKSIAVTTFRTRAVLCAVGVAVAAALPSTHGLLLKEAQLKAKLEKAWELEKARAKIMLEGAPTAPVPTPPTPAPMPPSPTPTATSLVEPEQASGAQQSDESSSPWASPSTSTFDIVSDIERLESHIHTLGVRAQYQKDWIGSLRIQIKHDELELQRRAQITDADSLADGGEDKEPSSFSLRGWIGRFTEKTKNLVYGDPTQNRLEMARSELERLGQGLKNNELQLSIAEEQLNIAEEQLVNEQLQQARAGAAHLDAEEEIYRRPDLLRMQRSEEVKTWIQQILARVNARQNTATTLKRLDEFVTMDAPIKTNPSSLEHLDALRAAGEAEAEAITATMDENQVHEQDGRFRSDFEGSAVEPVAAAQVEVVAPVHHAQQGNEAEQAAAATGEVGAEAAPGAVASSNEYTPSADAEAVELEAAADVEPAPASPAATSAAAPNKYRRDLLDSEIEVLQDEIAKTGQRIAELEAEKQQLTKGLYGWAVSIGWWSLIHEDRRSWIDGFQVQINNAQRNLEGMQKALEDKQNTATISASVEDDGRVMYFVQGLRPDERASLVLQKSKEETAIETLNSFVKYQKERVWGLGFASSDRHRHIKKFSTVPLSKNLSEDSPYAKRVDFVKLS